MFNLISHPIIKFYRLFITFALSNNIKFTMMSLVVPDLLQ